MASQPAKAADHAQPARIARRPPPAREVAVTMASRLSWLADISRLEPKDPELRRRLGDAEAFFACAALELASTFGLGEASPGVAQLVRSAALGCVGRDLAFERGDWHMFARLAQSVRQDLVSAHAITMREAISKRGQRRDNPAWTPTPSTEAEEDALALAYAERVESASRG